MESSKTIFAGIVAAGILGTTALAWAQPGSGCDGVGPKGMQGMRGMDGKPGMMKSGMKFDPAARADQHLTRLKTELKPTAQQEPLWNAFADKVKAESGSGRQAMQATMQNDKLTAPERMAAMNTMMKNRLASHEAVSDAFTRLYDSLTPEQKKVADQQASRMGQMDRGGGPGRQGKPAGSSGPQGRGGESEHTHG